MSEEIRSKSYLYIIVGMATLVGFALVLQMNSPQAEILHDASLNVLPVPSGSEKYPYEPLMCSSTFSPVLDESSKIKYNVKTPKVLPEGYSLQGVDAISGNGVEMITLYYWDKPICDVAQTLAGSPVLNGAIVVHIADSLKVPEAHAKMIDAVNRMVPKYDFKQLNINGIPAIGNQPSNGLSTAGVNEESFPYPARIFFTANKMLYNIEANMPLDELARLAESIS